MITEFWPSVGETVHIDTSNGKYAGKVENIGSVAIILIDSDASRVVYILKAHIVAWWKDLK